MKWKKLFGSKFFLIIFNTASVCILFIVLMVRKESTVLTRTFSYLTPAPINYQEIEVFLTTFEKPHKVKVRINNIETISYEERFTFEITFYDKEDEGLDKILKSEFENFFKKKLITKKYYKDWKFPQVRFNLSKGSFSIINTNGHKVKVPLLISMNSITTSSDSLKVFNGYNMENSELIEIENGMTILTGSKKDKFNTDKDVPLLIVQSNDQIVFFEVVEVF